LNSEQGSDTPSLHKVSSSSPFHGGNTGSNPVGDAQ
jgi:hypothetical protein